MITQKTKLITNIKTANGEVTVVNSIFISEDPLSIDNMPELLIEKTDENGYDSGIRIALSPDEIDELIEALKTAKKSYLNQVVQ